MKAERDKFALVVDDEPRIRSLIAEILETDGWKVTACSSAEEAIELGRRAGMTSMEVPVREVLGSGAMEPR